MAEAAGLAASVIAIVEITAKIGMSSMKLKKLWEDLQDVPERLKDLVEEIELWRSMMRQIEKQIRTSSSSVHQQLLEDLDLRAASGRCRSALDSLADFVDTLQQDVGRSTSRRQKIKLMKKIFSSAGPLDALDKRLHRAFSTLQGLLHVYNFSMGVGPKKHVEILPDSNNESTETSSQIVKPGLTRIAPLVDGPAHRDSAMTIAEYVRNEGSLQPARTSQLQTQPKEYEMHDYDVVISARLNTDMYRIKLLETQMFLSAAERQLSRMVESRQDPSSVTQLLEGILPIVKDYHRAIIFGSKDYRPPPQLHLSGARLSFLTSNVVWLVQNTFGSHRQYRIPRWLSDGRIEIKADRQRGCSELSVRFKFSVDWWDDETYRAVSDDDPEALLYLYSAKGLSIFQRNGWSLLHLAARLGSIRICHLLSLPSAMGSVKVTAKDMRRYAKISAQVWNDVNNGIRRSPWAFACLCTMGEQYAHNYLQILRSFAGADTIFESEKVEKCLERHETLIFVITRAWSSLFVQGFRRQFAPRYHSLELSQRLMCARLAARSVFYTCSVELFIDLLPEAEMADGTILALSREERCSIIHSVAFRIGRSSIDHGNRPESSSPDRFWHEILKSAVLMDADSLHFVENVAPFQIVPMHQTPFISFLQSAFDACSGNASDESIVRLLTRWLETLRSSGVNLLLYGREESRLYQANNSLLRHRFIAWTSRRQQLRIRLAGIVYGDLPSHWSLIWVDEPNGLAGDFWNSVEPQDRACQLPSGTIPGEWVDELDEDTECYDNENNDDIWRWAEAYEERRLVWTEYRRHRDFKIAVDICHGRKRRAAKKSKAKSGIAVNADIPHIDSQPGGVSVVAHSEPAKTSNTELGRKAKSFMKFWKRQR